MKSENQNEVSSIIDVNTNFGNICTRREADKNPISIKLDSQVTKSPQICANTTIDISDFDILSNLGEGAYAKVVLGRHKKTGEIYAIKMIDRKHIQKEMKEYQAKVERDVLAKSNHPNIIKLYYCFKNEEKLFFVLEYCPNGELFDMIKLFKTEGGFNFPVDLAKFYIAEIVNILEYLSSIDVSHRDLKPENILMGENMHLKLSDFGTAKIKGISYHDDNSKSGTTFVGTAEYVSPEVLLDKESSPASDLWALGCIIYHLFVGNPPFKSKTEYLTFDSIIKCKYTIPPGIDKCAQDLINKLIVFDPFKRLGSGGKEGEFGFKALKSHEFFQGIDFSNLYQQTPPIPQNILEKYQKIRPYSIIESYIDSDVGSNEEDTDDIFEDLCPSNSFQKKNSQIQFKLLKEGILQKKCGWLFYRARKLILTNQPRLSYYNVKKNEYKGDIVMMKNIKVIKINNRKFELITPSRKYYFKVLLIKTYCNEDCDDWIQAINLAISEYC